MIFIRRNLTFFFVTLFFAAQAQEMDSLIPALGKAKTDSSKILTLSAIEDACEVKDIESYALQQLKLIEEAQLRKSIHSKFAHTETARAYNDLGVYERSQKSNYLQAVEYYLKAATIIEKEIDPDQDLLSSIYSNLATAYIDLERYDFAKTYFNKCIELDIKKKNDDYLAQDYNNMAGFLFFIKDYKQAEYYFNKSIRYGILKKDSSSLTGRFCNLGEVCLNDGSDRLEAAGRYADSAFLYKKALAKENVLYNAYKLRFKIAVLKKQFDKVPPLIVKLTQLIPTAKLESADFKRWLYLYYKAIGDYRNSLENYIQWKDSRDSILSKDIKHKSEIRQLGFDSEKKQFELKLDGEKKMLEEKNKRKWQMYLSAFISLVALFIAGFSWFFYKRWKLTKKQKDIIQDQQEELTKQHQLLEAKSKAINQSLNYSKEIQTTLLNYHAQIGGSFKDYFIIHKPKDVVSGDFYWTYSRGSQTVVVVGDCTGHGVPGALISVLAIEALNNIISSGVQLNDTEEFVKQLRINFSKYYNAKTLISIGIDLNIVCFDKERHLATCFGSGSTMLILGKDKEMQKVKFDSFNIGGELPLNINSKPFLYNFSSLDKFYLFTDGIVDMKGEDGKKYSMQRFQDFILRNVHQNISEEKEAFNQEIERCTKGRDLVDDITLLGLQLE